MLNYIYARFNGIIIEFSLKYYFLLLSLKYTYNIRLKFFFSLSKLLI